MNFSRDVRVNATVVEIIVMSMNKKRLVCLGMVITMLAACSTTQTSAPVVDRSSSISSKPAIDASKSGSMEDIIQDAQTQSEADADAAIALVRAAVRIDDARPAPRPVVMERIDQ